MMDACRDRSRNADTRELRVVGGLDVNFFGHGAVDHLEAASAKSAPLLANQSLFLY